MKEILDWIAEVEQSELPSQVKKIVIEHLKAMHSALLAYRFGGIDDFIRAANNGCNSIVLLLAKIKHDTGVVDNQLKSLLLNLWGIVKVAATFAALTNDTLQAYPELAESIRGFIE